MIKHFAILIILIGFHTEIAAQVFEPTANSVSTTEIAAKIDREINSKFNNTILPAFAGMYEKGERCSNEILRNKVSLLVFWYPYCGCYNFHWLDTIAGTFKNAPGFQIIVVGADTPGLAQYRRERYQPYQYLALGSENKMHELNFNNGFVSFVLVDKFGVAVKVGLSKPTTYMDRIRELLTQ